MAAVAMKQNTANVETRRRRMVTPSEQSDDRIDPYTAFGVGDYTEFRKIWPEVFASVVPALCRRGVERSAAEDAVQEAGARAFSQQLGFADADDLGRWVYTVAWRLAVDEYRRHGQRRANVSAVESVRTADDVADTVQSRLEWRAAIAAWSQLSPSDRDALSNRPGPGDRRAAVRHAVRRHRARARLVAFIEAASAVFVALWARPRKSVRTVVLAGLPAIGLAIMVLPGGGPEHPRTGNTAVQATPAEPVGAYRDLLVRGTTEERRAASLAAPLPTGVIVQPDGTAPVDDVNVRTRPRDPEDHTACAWNDRAGVEVCADAPAEPRLSDLDDPVEDAPSVPEVLEAAGL